jgi:hypothetical protein
MHREPGTDLDLTGLPTAGRLKVGDGHYETLLHVGELDGAPMVTFTAPWGLADVTPTRPSGAYLRMLGRGLCEAHGWDVQSAAEYLASLAGARGAWRPADIARLLGASHGPSAPGNNHRYGGR